MNATPIPSPGERVLLRCGETVINVIVERVVHGSFEYLYMSPLGHWSVAGAATLDRIVQPAPPAPALRADRDGRAAFLAQFDTPARS